MNQSDLVLTDSGGIQEEAPPLGKPVLVMRDVTERTEAVLAETVKLVGTSMGNICSEIELILGDSDVYNTMSQAHNPHCAAWRLQLRVPRHLVLAVARHAGENVAVLDHR